MSVVHVHPNFAVSRVLFRLRRRDSVTEAAAIAGDLLKTTKRQLKFPDELDSFPASFRLRICCVLFTFEPK